MSRRSTARLRKKLRLGDMVTISLINLKKNGYAQKGFSIPKWLLFCEYILSNYPLGVYLYEANSTKSKYITLINLSTKFKIRFSDHAPNLKKEIEKDCDFFVGFTNFTKFSTRDALNAAINHFGLERSLRQELQLKT